MYNATLDPFYSSTANFHYTGEIKNVQRYVSTRQFEEKVSTNKEKIEKASLDPARL